MRTIKFRAWNKEENRILQGEPNFVNQHFYENENSKFPNLGTDFRVLQLMEFSGLLDKNGKEIYEGDIIREVTWTSTQKYDIKHEIKWSVVNSGFWVGTTSPLNEDSAEDIEIIGNIYENPELLSPVI